MPVLDTSKTPILACASGKPVAAHAGSIFCAISHQFKTMLWSISSYRLLPTILVLLLVVSEVRLVHAFHARQGFPVGRTCTNGGTGSSSGRQSQKCSPSPHRGGVCSSPSSVTVAASSGRSYYSVLFSTDAAPDAVGDRMPLKKGSIVAIVTPMTEDHKIDTDALRCLLRFHVASETDGLCILGTTGEASVLTMAERETVLKIAVEEVKNKIPILVGTGTIDPAAVREQTLQAIDLGCDASLVVTPYYVKPPQRCLVKHVHDAADLGLPVVVYNVPGRTGVDMTPETIGLAALHPNVVGVKEATGDVSRVQQLRSILRREHREDVLLYSGDDGTTEQFVLQGGDGCISVTANVAPRQVHDVVMAGLDGDSDLCHKLNAPLVHLHKRLFLESNPIPTKWALKRMGKIPFDTARPPLDALDPKHYDTLEEAMSEAGLI